MARCADSAIGVATRRRGFAPRTVKLACLLVAAGVTAALAGDSAKEDENRYLAEQLALAKQGNVWAKYELYTAYRNGTHGVKADLRQADHWLGEIVHGLHLVTFAPAGGFRPSTPREFLAKFKECSSLQSGRDRIGGASFFRTKLQGGQLIGSFITETPDRMIADIKRNPSLVFLWRTEVTPGIFVMHETSKQQSLK